MFKKAWKELGVDTKNEQFKVLQPPRIPKSESDHFRVPEGKQIIQADLTFYNPDKYNQKIYKYILTCYDLGNKACDLEPIESKEQTSIQHAFDEIFKRNIISPHTKIIQTDSGTEFGKEFTKWIMQKYNILHRQTRAGRKSQTSPIEGMNFVINMLLAVKTTINQRKGIVKQRNWVQYIPAVRRILKNREIRKKTIQSFIKPILVNQEETIKIGTRVFVKNDLPKDIHGNSLKGRFRLGDMRYNDKEPRIINDIHVFPAAPIRYRVSGIDNATFTRHELIVARHQKKSGTENKKEKNEEIDSEEGEHF